MKQNLNVCYICFLQSVHLNDVCNSSLASNQTNSYSNCQEHDTDYYYYNITDLKYPFTYYDFRIYVRSSVARGEDKWSPPGCITLKTKPTSKFILNKYLYLYCIHIGNCHMGYILLV